MNLYEQLKPEIKATLYKEAKTLIESHMDDSSEIFIDWVYSLQLKWGSSDGN